MRDLSTAATIARLALSATVLGLVLVARRPVPVPVLALPQPMPSEPSAAPALPGPRVPLSSALAATLTADDVARGVAALAHGEGPGLSADQRARLLPLALEGLLARQEVDTLQARRRRTRQDLRASGLALLSALGAAGWTATAPGVGEGAP